MHELAYYLLLFGVDTLYLIVRYADDHFHPLKREFAQCEAIVAGVCQG